MRIKIEPCKLKGTVTAPPSKSYAHRMLIGAALACLGGGSEGAVCSDLITETCRVTGISESEDMLATIDCLKALGLEVQKEDCCVSIFKTNESKGRKKSIGSAEVDSKDSSFDSESENCEGLDCNSPCKNLKEQLPVFSCRESGSTLRFMIPIALSACCGGVFRGTPRLIERGIGVYEEMFEKLGIYVEKTKDSITVLGSLPAGDYQIRGDVSSQFITGMLFALSMKQDDSRIEVLPPVESRSYIDITLDVLKQFGISVREEAENVFLIPGGQKFKKGEYQVEGDWSNAAFLFALQILGNNLEIQGVNPDSIQGDRACVRFLKQLKSGVTESTLTHLKQSPDSELDVSGPDEIEGNSDILTIDRSNVFSVVQTTNETIDLSDTPDLGPVLFAAAAALRGGHFTGTKRLRIKESDRAQAMAEELAKFGIPVLVGENDVIVLHSPLRKPAVPLNGHNDHRIVMALSVLASLMGAEIEDAQAVAKSWPGFFETLEEAGLKWFVLRKP
ncbi:MAG: 3-phosphoshikimate 1-carboxyvinyltransferase [Parasporobacterium sp.]|nr:3-phosphoshikimate 1-carboxyvinyltransferase [Parasporobacterium sp.]